jgi:hypothetical protein
MKPSTHSNETNETVVADPAWVLALVWIGFPPLGAVAGWLLNLVVVLVALLPSGPFHAAFELAASIPEPQGTIGGLVLGGLAGTAIAYQTVKERITVTVTDDRVNLALRGSVRDFPRASVSAVFLDGKRLVLLGAATEELAREPCELNAVRLGDAFRTHGFAWQGDGDPYREEYRQWAEDTPDLPVSVNALLKARARALAKGERDDAAELRAELAKVGIVVRDEKTRQSWRHARGAPGAWTGRPVTGS